MSWFSMPKAAVAHTTAKAADVDANFDAIEDAFNGLFKGDRVSASADLVLFKDPYTDVPGASGAVSPPVPSLLFVWAVFSVTGEVTGVVNLDGADQPYEAAGGGEFVPQVLCLKLNAGAHTVKLRAKADAGTVHKTNTGFTYLLVPNPEP